MEQKYNIGDIIQYGKTYVKICKVERYKDTYKYYGISCNTIYEAINSSMSIKKATTYLTDEHLPIIKSADGKIVPEIEKLFTLSRREQIIYLANKYKDRILKYDFLKDKQDLYTIAKELGMDKADIYKYFTIKLKICRLTNTFNEWKYFVWDSIPEEEKKKKVEERDRVINNEAFFTNYDVWKLLAYYCKYCTLKEAKTVLSRFERFYEMKDGARIKEMWTPLFYPDYNYSQSKFLPCKILSLRAKTTCVYDAELLEEGMTDTIDKKQYLNKHCIVIVNDAQKRIIDTELDKMHNVKVIGIKETPYRNKTDNILKIICEP